METAFLLGYSEVSAFHRSFKQWTGRTPSRYRRENATPAPQRPRRTRPKGRS
jgi:AraC-like DNA-binding protein